ncbi:MAG TPA: DUF802 domain-containing protein, partial [Rhodocyclaceae bacterium]|nr:DUF802 domain-containing protein [Rhodocyclaceae bacterium]
MNRNLCIAAFFLGLAAVAWVAVGYIGSHPLAFFMTLAIGLVYSVGALEMLRFHQATGSLAQALRSIPDSIEHLGHWLDGVHSSLQNPVRLRIEGERVGLPGPAVTPYLVGLLVLMGMLGTFLGMVVTLNGAVLALESTTDLQTIRAALAAPVKGLGVAFGTSVAGVAASAMLGLISALCRRERLHVGQLLDSKIATVLRVFSMTHQRLETFKALQYQAQVLPDVVDKLQAMMAQMEQQSQQLNERLIANQEGFHRDAKEVYSGLAASVDKSLKESLTESARLAGATIQPVVEATMAGIARETCQLHEKTVGTVQQQLDGLAERFSTTVSTVENAWSAALAQHQRTSEELNSGLEKSLEAFAQTFEQRSASLLASVDGAHAALRTDLAATVAGVAQEANALNQRLAETVTGQVEGLSARFGGTVAEVAQAWTDAIAKHENASAGLAQDIRTSLEGVAQSFEERSATLVARIGETQAALQSDLAGKDQERQDALARSLETMAASLKGEWQAAGDRTLAQQEQICRTLGDTARDIATQAEAHATNTINEIARLMQAAAEAPRAAAEVIGQLRQELSDSIVQDNQLLEERTRIMATLGTLLEAINHASKEQRGAIDALVSSSATLLERASTQFNERVETESARMVAAASEVAAGAVEVSSLGEAFGLAVQLFSESNDKLMAGLQRIEASLGKSMARSDEQLAYYVAQAREIIDLSILSQKRVVEDLQRLSG